MKHYSFFSRIINYTNKAHRRNNKELFLHAQEIDALSMGVKHKSDLIALITLQHLHNKRLKTALLLYYKKLEKYLLTTNYSS